MQTYLIGRCQNIALYRVFDQNLIASVLSRLRNQASIIRGYINFISLNEKVVYIEEILQCLKMFKVSQIGEIR